MYLVEALQNSSNSVLYWRRLGICRNRSILDLGWTLTNFSKNVLIHFLEALCNIFRDFILIVRQAAFNTFKDPIVYFDGTLAVCCTDSRVHLDDAAVENAGHISRRIPAVRGIVGVLALICSQAERNKIKKEFAFLSHVVNFSPIKRLCT